MNSTPNAHSFPVPSLTQARVLDEIFTPSRSDTTADILVEKLILWGIDTIFGVVGDGINGIVEALRKRKDRIRFVSVRHEEAAAFMACGHAKLTGRIGACLATTGPGAIHLLNGIYDAALDGAPVIAITGTTYQDLTGTRYMQEVDTVGLFRDVAVYNLTVTGPRHAVAVVDLACRAALSQRGVAHLTVAIDVQQQKYSDDKPAEPAKLLTGDSSWVPPLTVPVPESIQAAANLLNEGQRVLILAGRGALGARAEVEMIAELLGAPVTCALLGRTVLADDSPYSLHGIGHLGSAPAKELMQKCDTLLILGSRMPYLDFYPKPGQARCVQVDRDPRWVGLRYPAEIGLCGDIRCTLPLLSQKLKRQTDRSFLGLAQKKMGEWREALARRERVESDAPLKGETVMAALRQQLAPDAMITIDCGTHTGFAARHLNFREGQQICVSGTLATMAPGLPYAIAAQLAYPDRQCVAVVGDGGLTMLMGELATAARWRLPIRVVVLKNHSLGMVESEQKELGNPTYAVELQPLDFVKVAEGCGVRGFRCGDAAELGGVLSAAFTHAGPCLIEVEIDPREELPEPKELLH